MRWASMLAYVLVRSPLFTRTINMVRRWRLPSQRKGSNSKRRGIKCPKSMQARGTFPFADISYDVLTDHFAEFGADGYLIKNERLPDQPLSMQGVSDHFCELMRLEGLKLTKPDSDEVLWTTHANRHFFISARLQLGANIVELSKEVGHAQTSTTLDTYGHLLEGHRDIAPIWRERFELSEPGQGRVIEGEVIEYKPEPLAIECSRPWVNEAVRLLESGWKPAAVAKHLGQHRTTINTTFHKLGLPPPNKFVLEARDRRYQELHAKGYGDKEIAKLTNTGRVTVTNWRQTFENGVPNSRKALLELQSDLRQNGDRDENTQ